VKTSAGQKGRFVPRAMMRDRSQALHSVVEVASARVALRRVNGARAVVELMTWGSARNCSDGFEVT
jgi:hypothetical protein